MGSEYPMRWRHEPRGGYGYVQVVPCRVVRQGEKRVQIAALRADGTEALRWVEYGSLRAPSPAALSEGEGS